MAVIFRSHATAITSTWQRQPEPLVGLQTGAGKRTISVLPASMLNTGALAFEFGTDTLQTIGDNV